MKKETYDLEIDWWFPFFIFSPSMIFFIIASWYYWHEPLTVIPVILLFSFATFNFVYGYIRMFLSKIIVQDDGLIYDYFFIHWKVMIPPVFRMQRVARFSPIGSMTFRQIALISSQKIIYINDTVDYERFKKRLLIDYGGEKKL
jgi:hypothetical protein